MTNPLKTRTAQVTHEVVAWLQDHDWPAVAEDLAEQVFQNGGRGAATVLGRFIEAGGDPEDHNPPWTRDVIALFAAWLWAGEVALLTRNVPDEGLEVIERELRRAMNRPWNLTPGGPDFRRALLASLERSAEALRETHDLMLQAEGAEIAEGVELDALTMEEWDSALTTLDRVHASIRDAEESS